MAGDNQFDLVILGGGSGGYACAFRAADLGMSVALIEKAEVGGTCLHRGCIPTKALLHAGEVADNTREAAQFGVAATFHGIDMAAVNSYKDGVVGQLYKGLQGIVKARKIEFIAGEGKLVSANTVQVNGQNVTGSNVVLATGSVPKSLPGLEIDGNRDDLQRPRPEAGLRAGLGDHPRRRRHRLRVRLGLEVLRHRRDHHRRPAAPGPAGGRELLQAAGARVPPPRHQVRTGQLLLRRGVHRERRARLDRQRQDLRGRPDAGGRRPRPGLRGPGLRGGRGRHGPRLRQGRPVLPHLGPRRLRGRRPDPDPAAGARRLRRGHLGRRAHRRAEPRARSTTTACRA